MLDALMVEHGRRHRRGLERDAVLLATVGNFFQRLWTPPGRKVADPFKAADFLPDASPADPEPVKEDKLTDKQRLVYLQMLLAGGGQN